jgi:hypothetical protein
MNKTMPPKSRVERPDANASRRVCVPEGRESETRPGLRSLRSKKMVTMLMTDMPAQRTKQYRQSALVM